MAEVILNFDTEDYTSELSDWAAGRLADIMTQEGVRGSFNVVGELARKLAASPNRTCVEALARHEINCHSLRHSWHPTIAEYCDTTDWTEGLCQFYEQETECISLIKDAFNRERLWAAVPPGNAITMQAAYGYGKLGIPIYSDSLFKNTRGRGVWYCGTFHLESMFFIESMIFDNQLDAMINRLDELAAWDRVLFYTHPNMAVYRQFWDSLNMRGENRVAWGRWHEPERRSAQETNCYFDGFRRLVRALRDHGGFDIVTYEDVYKNISVKRRNPLIQADIPDVLKKAVGRFFHFQHRGHSYSLADAFFAAAHFLRGSSLPWIPHDGLGPIDEPYAVTEAVTVSKDDLRKAAANLADDAPIPTVLTVAGITIGPGDFLRAANAYFQGSDSIVITPGRAIPDVTNFFDMNQFRLKGTWLHSYSFQDNWVRKRLMNQSWTIRLEKPEDELIYAS